MEYSIDQIKDLYCKFKCQSHDQNLEADGYSIDPCEICQIDSFIQELEDYKIINS